MMYLFNLMASREPKHNAGEEFEAIHRHFALAHVQERVRA